jgi:hypothetical protein
VAAPSRRTAPPRRPPADGRRPPQGRQQRPLTTAPPPTTRPIAVDDLDDDYAPEQEEVTGEEIAREPMSPRARNWWAALIIGGLLGVFAIAHHVLVPLVPAGFLKSLVTWLAVVGATFGLFELIRLRRREMARGARKHGLRGAKATGRGLRAARGKAAVHGGTLKGKAADRWQNRERRSGRHAAGGPGHGVDDDPDAIPSPPPPPPFPGPPITLRPPPAAAPPPAAPPERTENAMPTEVTADNWGAATSESPVSVGAPPTPVAAGTRVPALWARLNADVVEYIPEKEGELLEWMRGQVKGMAGYAEAVIAVYESCVRIKGLDPVAMRALHQVADAAAAASREMALARRKYATHYAQVRDFVAGGGVLARDGRFHDAGDY